MSYVNDRSEIVRAEGQPTLPAHDIQELKRPRLNVLEQRQLEAAGLCALVSVAASAVFAVCCIISHGHPERVVDLVRPALRGCLLPSWSPDIKATIFLG